MEKSSARKCCPPRVSVTGVLALLLVICLAECATGSCLSYGHSCWGAHGKRSGKAPASAPDWYITRILRRMAANSELNRARHLEPKADDLDDIFRVEVEDAPSNRLATETEDAPMDLGPKALDAKPMLDDVLLSKMKIWQMMREASEEK